MRSFSALLAPLAMAGLLTACDGEKADYTTDIYDISWVFVAGDATFEEAGIYIGPGALKPGARSGAVTWGDADNLWLFGGRGRDSVDAFGNLNDLWRYDGSAWVKVSGSEFVGSAGVYGTQGVPHADNHPGARRDALSWTDDQGNFWLFGGFGYDEAASEGLLNDLWVYQWDADAGTGLWTWVGGAKTVGAYGVYGTQGTPDALNWPGARREAAGWVELETVVAATTTTQARNLWLFGGYGNAASDCCVLNDVWRYQPADPVTDVGTWTWVKGDDAHGALPVYGSTGFSDPANTPGSRYGAVAWRESHGGVWLYGGRGFNATGTEVVFGELWKLVLNNTDPDNPTWDWAYVAGTQGAYAAPVYASRGVVSFTNQPGSRYRPQAWTTADDRLCLFGGEVWGSATATAPARPADLWCFDVLAWNWLGGTIVDDPVGDYPAVGGRGTPGGRSAGATWVGEFDTLWLFGGESVDADADPARRSDLWLITP